MFRAAIVEEITISCGSKVADVSLCSNPRMRWWTPEVSGVFHQAEKGELQSMADVSVQQDKIQLWEEFSESRTSSPPRRNSGKLSLSPLSSVGEGSCLN